jgi:hypothetical protein
MLAYTPNPALYLSPEMVAELALGQDPPLDIASKYGFSAAEFQQLQAQPWFGAAIYRKREELQASGITFAAKAAMMAEEMWQDIYTVSKGSEMRMEHRLEAAKQLSSLGGLAPKEARGANTGPQFTITIQIPSDAQGPSMRKIEQAEAKPDPMVIDLTPGVSLPPVPAGFKVPDFKLTDDLVGKPAIPSVAGQALPVNGRL